MLTTLQPSAPPQFAGHRPIIRKTARAGLWPREPISVDDYALQKRWLSNPGGGYVGRWRHDLVPYLIEPMQCLTSLDFMTVAVVGPGQSAKTQILENWFLHSVGVNPAKMLWLMQTEDAVEAYVKDRINPMIDMHDVLRDALGSRPVDDSLHYKRFATMSVEFLSATLRNLINKSAPRIALDEIDAYPDELGDPMALADIRRQTFGRQSMVCALSHPDKAKGLVPERDWTAGIMAVFADSTRCLWYWPCPHCGAFSSPCPTADRFMALEYPSHIEEIASGQKIKRPATLDEIEAGARLVCPVNDCQIENHHRRAMNARGKWVGRGQTISEDGVVAGERIRSRTAGFWIVGVMSPLNDSLGGIGGLARARVKAERELEVSGEDETLRQVMVKQWGIPYSPPKSVGSIDANDLADRAENELKLGTVPEGVRFLTVAVDCQIAHFEWLVRGWGVHGESWIVDKGRLPADPSTSPDDWDALIDLFFKAWPLADGSGRGMSPRACAFDSGGAPGVTQQAYAAWKRWRKQRAVKLFGTISGRDCWSIIPTKGASGLNAARLQVVYPDTARKANVSTARGEVPVAMFNPNAFKDDLAGQFMKGEPGPWYVHFPSALRSAEAPHAWFEQAVAERKDAKSGRWERVNRSARNEALDLLVMTHIAAHLHGLSKINWERPPSWAAPWDANSLVSSSTAAAVLAPLVKPSVATDAAAAPKKPGTVASLIDKFKP